MAKSVPDPSDIDVVKHDEQQSHFAPSPSNRLVIHEETSPGVSIARGGATIKDTSRRCRDMMAWGFRVDKAKALITVRVSNMNGEQGLFAINNQRRLWELAHLVEKAFDVQYGCEDTVLELLMGTTAFHWRERRMPLQSLGVTDGSHLSFVLRSLNKPEALDDVEQYLWTLHMKTVPTQTIKDKAFDFYCRGLISMDVAINVIEAICMERFTDKRGDPLVDVV